VEAGAEAGEGRKEEGFRMLSDSSTQTSGSTAATTRTVRRSQGDYTITKFIVCAQPRYLMHFGNEIADRRVAPSARGRRGRTQNNDRQEPA
jgi:hypothetical protein